jgi:hypothetical protein
LKIKEQQEAREQVLLRWLMQIGRLMSQISGRIVGRDA